MIPAMPNEPWQHPLFTPETPVEIILSLARAFCAQPMDEAATPEQAALDLTIARMLTVELFQRGADYREVPWPLRLEHVRLTGQSEGYRPRRPPAP